jgi:hypothetical protein
MRCIPTEEGCSILQDIHLGVCGSHTGARILVGKEYSTTGKHDTFLSDFIFLGTEQYNYDISLSTGTEEYSLNR